MIRSTKEVFSSGTYWQKTMATTAATTTTTMSAMTSTTMATTTTTTPMTTFTKTTKTKQEPIFKAASMKKSPTGLGSKMNQFV